MAKQLVNTGSVANDGTGDTLRVAFTKINDNSDELYESLALTTSLRSWSRNTTYKINDLILEPAFGSNAIYRVHTAYTSGDAFSQTDLNYLSYVAQEFIVNYPSGAIVPKGFKMKRAGAVYQRKVPGIITTLYENNDWEKLSPPFIDATVPNHVPIYNSNQDIYEPGFVRNESLAPMVDASLKGRSSGAPGHPQDISLGGILSMSSTAVLSAIETPKIPNWTANKSYLAGDLAAVTIGAETVYLRSNTTRNSTATFNLTELTNWSLVSQLKNGTSFPVSTIVCTGFTFSLNNIIYQSNSTRTTTATFNAAEQTNWTQLTALSLIINPSIFTANGTALLNQVNLVNSSALRTITAPSTTILNNKFSVVDATGQAATNNITISFTGSSLYGVANDIYIISVNKMSVTFIYTGASIGWIII